MKFFINKLSSPKIISIISWTIFLIPFVIYGLYIFRYAVNIPVQDDYHVVLDFMNKFIQAQTPEKKIELLFSLHNEHRLVFDRIVFLSYYYFFHEVNFKSFIVFGNLGWILTIVMLVIYLQKNFNLSLAHLLPISYLLLSIVHWENMFFAMASIQNYWFVFFSIAFLICLSKDKIFLYCVLFPIALFTSGGGVVLYPLSNLFLVLQKKWKSLALFFALSTSCMALYFYDYHKPTHHPSIFGAILTPFRTIAYFFSFFGNFLPSTHFSFFIGLLLCLLSSYFIIKRYGDDFLQLTIGFIGLIALMITLTRSGFGVWQAVSSRYTIFPLIALVCIYCFIITSISRKSVAHKILIVGTLLCAMFYWGIVIVYVEYTHYFIEVRDERIASIVTFSNGDNKSLLLPNPDQAAQILLTAKQQHIYNYQDQLP